MKRCHLLSTLALVAVVALSGCKTKVTRVGSETDIDLSGRWNDSDSRRVSEKMIASPALYDRIDEYTAKNGKKPVVIVGMIRNLSSEHIQTETFTTDLERALINSGRVTFVAADKQRAALREERKQQQTWSTTETAKRLAAETGADLMLQGSIKTITDQEGKKSVIFYQIDLELIDLETTEKVWIESEKIKKYVKKNSFSF
ncbi:penicillin-binding protein activator LpoB [Pontiellaceae bacterium B1224]|nr:penicillin-binding protein activator LpoB [Pontiellaceae bacterium B1224]